MSITGVTNVTFAFGTFWNFSLCFQSVVGWIHKCRTGRSWRQVLADCRWAFVLVFRWVLCSQKYTRQLLLKANLFMQIPNCLLPTQWDKDEELEDIKEKGTLGLIWCLKTSQKNWEAMSHVIRGLHDVLRSYQKLLWWQGFLGGASGKEPTWQCRSKRDVGSIPGLGRSPGGGHDTLLQYFYLKNPHGQRSLVGYSPEGHKELDRTAVT